MHKLTSSKCMYLQLICNRSAICNASNSGRMLQPQPNPYPKAKATMLLPSVLRGLEFPIRVKEIRAALSHRE